MRTTEDGMNMAYAAAQAGMTPNEKPDNLTDGENGGGQGEELNNQVLKGQANDGQLGDYILDMT